MQNTSYFGWLLFVTVLVGLCVGHAWELDIPEQTVWYLELVEMPGVERSANVLGMSFGLLLSTVIYLVGAFGVYLWGLFASRNLPVIFSNLISISMLALISVTILLYLP